MYFLDHLQVRCNCAKFHQCRMCVTEFREGGVFLAPPKVPPSVSSLERPILNRVNVGTIRGRSAEIVEMLFQCNVDICYVKETCWKGELARKIMPENCHYKFFSLGDESEHGVIGILIKEKWSESVLSISRVNLCIMMLKMLV